MQIINITGYKFITLNELEALRTALLTQCHAALLKGTILLSHEGININLSGLEANISAFKAFLSDDARFADMTFRQSFSENQPFKNLKIKIKKEIITLRQPEADPTVNRAPSMAPAQLKQWLDEKRDMVLLDTRNTYEMEVGAFSGALNLQLKHFTDLPEAVAELDKDKPIVMYCTGGIRCEKAALYMLNAGFSEVYQLDGGILNYFVEVGDAHYEGKCFVFDERVSLGADSFIQS